jgi:magnesium-transporting ATPase (P-type)
MAVSLAIQSWIEGGVIAGVIILNIVVGFFQEFNAEKTMDSLRSLSSPTANVVRDGQIVNITTAELVPGDMVELKTGDTVPADLRFVIPTASMFSDYSPDLDYLNPLILRPMKLS